MLKHRILPIFLLILSSNITAFSWQSVKEANWPKIIDTTEKVALGAAFLYMTHYQWRQLLFNERHTLESLGIEDIPAIKSSYYNQFHFQVLKEAGIADAETFAIFPQEGGLLSAAIGNGIVFSCTALDYYLIKLEAFLIEQSIEGVGSILLSLERLIALYQCTDLPVEIHDSIEKLLLYRAILYHEAGHYVNGDVTRLGALRALCIQAGVFSLGYAVLNVAHHYIGMQQINNWVDRFSPHYNNQYERFLKLHSYSIAGIFAGTAAASALGNLLHSRWQEMNADIHACMLANQYELEQFIRIWQEVDREFTADLEDALKIAYAYNGYYVKYIDLDAFAEEFGMHPNDIRLSYAACILNSYITQNIINMPKGLTGDSPVIRKLFVHTHPDHRDRIANGKRIYKERFGIEYSDEMDMTAVAA